MEDCLLWQHIHTLNYPKLHKIHTRSHKNKIKYHFKNKEKLFRIMTSDLGARLVPFRDKFGFFVFIDDLTSVGCRLPRF